MNRDWYDPPDMRRIALLLACSTMAAAQDLESEVVALELGRNYDQALFTRAFHHQAPRVRRAAARAAGRIKDPRAKDPLIALLRDEVGPVRRAALFALGQIGGSELLVPLRHSLTTLKGADLPHALEALGKTRDARAVPTVVGYLQKHPPEVRGEAALALFRIGDQSALPELFGALAEERDPEVRWRMVYAAYSLLQAKVRNAKAPLEADASWKTILDASLATDRPYQERIFAALARGTMAGYSASLVPLLEDKDSRVVVAAIRALRRWPDLKHMDSLEEIYKSKGQNTLVREAVVRYFIAAIPKDLVKEELRASDVSIYLTKARHRAEAYRDHRLNQLAREAEARVSDSAFIDLDRATEELLWRVASHRPEYLSMAPPKTLKGQLAAAEVCGEERVPKDFAVKTLLGLLKIKDFTVRSTAIGSLAKRGAKDKVHEIVAAAKDSPGTVDSDVRLAAAEALGTLAVYDRWLKQAASDPDHPVRKAARATLKKLERPLPPAPPNPGFSLMGLDAAAVRREARLLAGARVTLKTNRGDIVMVLYPDEAPAHCVNFARLVEKGFYNDRTWHRVVADFVIQGGCPRGDGWGGPGYFLPDEIGTRPYVRGTVGMPKSGDDTGGCQIFITHLPTPHLDGRYTVYAQVIEGLAVMDRIRVGDRIIRATLKRAIR